MTHHSQSKFLHVRNLELASQSEKMLNVNRRNNVHASILKRRLSNLDSECKKKLNKVQQCIYDIYHNEQLPRKRELASLDPDYKLNALVAYTDRYLNKAQKGRWGEPRTRLPPMTWGLQYADNYIRGKGVFVDTKMPDKIKRSVSRQTENGQRRSDIACECSPRNNQTADNPDSETNEGKLAEQITPHVRRLLGIKSKSS